MPFYAELAAKSVEQRNELIDSYTKMLVSGSLAGDDALRFRTLAAMRAAQ